MVSMRICILYTILYRKTFIMKKSKAFKQKVLTALEKHLGVITTACKEVGLDRSNLYRWMDEDYEFRQAVNEIKDVAIDLAETELHKQIKDGNITAIIFYLKTQAKNRGYIERQEIANIDPSENMEEIDRRIKELLREI